MWNEIKKKITLKEKDNYIIYNKNKEKNNYIIYNKKIKKKIIYYN